MSETLDEAGLLAAELLARRWLPRKHPRVRRALVDADLWQALQDRLAQVGLRLVDNIHADHISVALVRPAEYAVFGEAGMNANNNLDLPRDAISLLVVLWSLIVLPKRERQSARAAGDHAEQQEEMFHTEKPMPSAAEVSPVVSYKALLADFGNQLGKKTRMDTNLRRLEAHGFILRRGDDIAEGPLLDLLLDYDALAPRILDGALGDVLARANARDEASPAQADAADITHAADSSAATESTESTEEGDA
ncbi:hypothetical protein RB25_03960 [Herbaspirillum rubrisubalbicans]|uniref:DUF4194 domain-containing protein n=1 Tax=Herbaspirillum rubrisubalbicans TaxID=80842 RepID=A0ABX9BVA1_9BURK|nr:hypothetical protein [Herbaspirillum rubrisubalbicans]RAM61714.1 hypothetical protein RB24_23960 [Herbaspirillum rubrisubalbicans]RAN49542.1 hypothetical protein RB25_03960 [Herbaspirillum rubrisubalbicans]